MEVSRSLLARTEEFVLVPSFRRRPESSPPSFPRKRESIPLLLVVPPKAPRSSSRRRPGSICFCPCFRLRRSREDRLTSVCVSSTIPGRRLLSFACPKESNQRKGHPRVRGLPGFLPGKLREQATGFA